MTQRFTIPNICIDISTELMFYSFQLIFYLRFTGTEHQKITLAVMLVNRRTDAIGQQVRSLFPDQPSDKYEQRLLNIQTKLPADLLFILKLSFLYFFGVIVFCDEIICIRVPH